MVADSVEDPAGGQGRETSGPRVFAVTGCMGAGKSTVARRLRQGGVPVVDADQVARAVVAPDTPGLDAVVSAFGQGILLSDGSLDRGALGRIVFGDADARARLNALLHPLVRDEVARRVKALGEEGVAIVAYDIPLLFETEQQERYRPVVAVLAPREQCIARVVERDGLTEEEATRRFDSQISPEEKRRGADIVIDNDGSKDDLERKTDRVLAEIRARLAPGSEDSGRKPQP